MNLLAIDTCTELCSVALRYKGKYFRDSKVTQRGHSDIIFTMLDSLFSQAGTSIAAIDAIAFGRGPGSFTGVRVGVSVAQGIAFARDISVIGISSLASIALRSAEKYPADEVAVAMDARMGEVYCAQYHYSDDRVVLSSEEKVCVPEQAFLAKDNTSKARKNWVAAGSAWAIYQSALMENFTHPPSATDSESLPEAYYILRLAEYEIEQGRLVSPEQALPVYLRDNVAKKSKQYEK